MIARAWITGASSGIGRALALALARGGSEVAVSARRTEMLERLAEQNRRIRPFPLDVGDADATARAVAAIEDAVGPLDVAVFNAGTHEPVVVETLTPEPFRHLMEVNYMGAVNGIAAVLPRFLARRQGRIAVVASVAGYRGLPQAAAYGPSKAALINLCEALKPDLDPYRVGISVINPGFVRTPLTDRNPFPMPFLMEPDAAAQHIVRGLNRGDFEIAFPRRFVALLKLGRVLPYRLYFRLVKRTTGRG